GRSWRCGGGCHSLSPRQRRTDFLPCTSWVFKEKLALLNAMPCWVVKCACVTIMAISCRYRACWRTVACLGGFFQSSSAVLRAESERGVAEPVDWTFQCQRRKRGQNEPDVPVKPGSDGFNHCCLADWCLPICEGAARCKGRSDHRQG